MKEARFKVGDRIRCISKTVARFYSVTDEVGVVFGNESARYPERLFLVAFPSYPRCFLYADEMALALAATLISDYVKSGR